MLPPQPNPQSPDASTSDGSMTLLQYAVAGIAIVAAVLLSLVR